MDARHLLVETHSHLPPAATLGGLAPPDAVRRMAGLPHSIADLVAHLAFWQSWFTRRCEGEDEPMIASASLGWPDVSDAQWPEVRDGFLAGLEHLAHVVEQLDPDAPISPAIAFPLLSGYTARDVWEHVAQHNAHHLGQVVMLRQLLGLWPPPAGSYTW